MKRILFFLLLVSGVAMGQGSKVVIRSGTTATLDSARIKKLISDSLNNASIVFGSGDFYGAGTSASNLRVKGKADSTSTISALAGKSATSHTHDSSTISGLHTEAYYNGRYNDTTKAMYFDTASGRMVVKYGTYKRSFKAFDSVSLVTSGGGGGGGGSSSTSAVTGQTLGTNKSSFTGLIGMRFTVGGSNITVDSLGRWVAPGNSASHVLRIIDASNNVVVSCTLNLSGSTSGQFAYQVCTSTVLTAGTTYYLMTQEAAGTDTWYDEDATTITVTSAITRGGSAYSDVSPISTVNSTPSPSSYGPVSLKYH